MVHPRATTLALPVAVNGINDVCAQKSTVCKKCSIPFGRLCFTIEVPCALCGLQGTKQAKRCAYGFSKKGRNSQGLYGSCCGTPRA
jgi:hypothetical protein